MGRAVAGLRPGERGAASCGPTVQSVVDYGVNRSASRRASGKRRAEAPVAAAKGHALEREPGVPHPRRERGRRNCRKGGANQGSGRYVQVDSLHGIWRGCSLEPRRVELGQLLQQRLRRLVAGLLARCLVVLLVMLRLLRREMDSGWRRMFSQ
jgi:hypothetical protein